ncbi:MAG: hypothetical protein NW223_23195 [Hyphomicrobiaceae bacterium]|nr:hypothetical protein [Hyphomicrobiaceae bacterium]
MSKRPAMEMGMLKKLIGAATALVVLGGVLATSVEEAKAHDGRGIAAGLAIGTILGLGIAGAHAGPRYRGPAYYADVPPGCYRGPRQCGWEGRRCWYDRYGEYVCRGGEWRCWRPTVCD